MIKKATLIITAILEMTFSCHAWVYPEHREITLIAIQKLDPAQRTKLDQLWAMARTGHESRLDKSVANLT